MSKGTAVTVNVTTVYLRLMRDQFDDEDQFSCGVLFQNGEKKSENPFIVDISKDTYQFKIYVFLIYFNCWALLIAQTSVIYVYDQQKAFFVM